jgi:hypothetical protein
VIPENAKLPEEQLVTLYNAWLENASIKNWFVLEDIKLELGNSSETANWGIPDPMPIRIEEYFRAKANREFNMEKIYNENRI